MPIIDAAVEEAFLDAIFSADTTNLPTTWDIAILTDNPAGLTGAAVDALEMGDETEVDDGMGGTVMEPNGYARVSITTATDWVPAADRQKTTVAPVQFPTVTCDEGYPDAGVFWAAWSPELSAWGPYAALLEPLEVTGSGDGPTLALTQFFADSVEAPE